MATNLLLAKFLRVCRGRQREGKERRGRKQKEWADRMGGRRKSIVSMNSSEVYCLVHTFTIIIFPNTASMISDQVGSDRFLHLHPFTQSYVHIHSLIRM